MHEVGAGKRIALCNVNGRFYAIDDVCTHDGGPLDQGELTAISSSARATAQVRRHDGQPVILPAVAP